MAFGDGHTDPFLVVGLGNPGVQYELTRHNAGFLVIDYLSDIHSISLKEKRTLPGVLSGQGKIGPKTVFFAKPLSFMNRSGLPTYRLADYFHIPPENMLVIHDDVDLPFHTLKLKFRGGDGGHKGVRSLLSSFSGADFLRLRMGVGRSEYGEDTADFVLSRFSKEELDHLEDFLKMSCDAVETVLLKGQSEAMNQFNRSTGSA